MNKKSVILFASFLLLLGVVLSAGDLSSFTISTPRGDGFEVAGWTTGGVEALVNLTVTAASTANLSNVTVVIDTVAGNYSWNFAGQSGGSVVLDGVDEWNYSSTSVLDATGGNLTSWECRNATGNIFSCNSSTNTIDGGNPTNNSIIIMLNITGIADGLESLDVNWTAYACGTDVCDAESNGVANSSTFYLNSDNQQPRLIELNVTDGNQTLLNGTNMSSTYLDSSNIITVTGIITDQKLDETGAYLYCASNITASRQDYEQISTITLSGNTSNFSVNVPSVCISDGDTATFFVFANDSFNQNIEFNESALASGGIPFALTINNTINPKIAVINVTQSYVDSEGTSYTVTRTSGTNLNGGYYMGARNSTFNVEVSGHQKSDSVALVFKNDSTPLKYLYNGQFDPASVNDTILMYNVTGGYNDSTGIEIAILENSVDFGSYSDNASFEFYIIANNTDDNYTAVAGPYRFELDVSGPGEPTMTVPTDRSIGPRDSITYTCESSDAKSATAKIKWELTKPDGTTVTKKFADTTSNKHSVTFTGDDTSLSGTYTVKCTALDNVGREASHTSSSSETFQAFYSISGEAGGGEGGAAGVTFDIDFSTSDEATLKVPQGTIKTFSFDGSTEHTITFKEVTSTTVTLEIASTPVTVTLVIGEAKSVDINGDGVNDLVVKLNGITNSKADVTFTKVKEGADLIVQQEAPTGEQPPSGEQPPAEGITPPEVEGEGGTAWIWITVIVIIAVIVVGYFLLRKKKQ